MGQALKELKHDLAVSAIHHQLDHRIKAPIFISFLACALQVTLKTRLKHVAKALTPRSTLEKFVTLQMLVMHLPTSDGREIIMARYTHPEKDLHVILDQLKLALHERAPPHITTPTNDELNTQNESSL